VDISKDFLLASTRRLAADYPWLEVHAAWADFSEHLDLTYLPPRPRRLAFFPGSSIGNFHPPEAQAFLLRLAGVLGSAGILVIGVDLKKDSRMLHAAYNDDQGITAAFNLNLLTRIRNELDTDLDPARFEHRAHYNALQGCIEMHLVSRDRQRLWIEDRYFDFAPGETIHTENSYKYRLDEFSDLAAGAGYRVERVWTDEQTLFGVYFLRVS
jgi:dimethylhistidine N-methyltransferase